MNKFLCVGFISSEPKKMTKGNNWYVGFWFSWVEKSTGNRVYTYWKAYGKLGSWILDVAKKRSKAVLYGTLKAFRYPNGKLGYYWILNQVLALQIPTNGNKTNNNKKANGNENSNSGK